MKHNGNYYKRANRSLKRIIAVLLYIPLLLSITMPTAFAAEANRECLFPDVAPDAWYFDAVRYVSENGIFLGESNGSFNPDGIMTRAMLVTALWRSDGRKKATPASFSDVAPDIWYAQAVAWASQNNIILGIGNNRFQPDAPVTREQAVTILYRYAAENTSQGDSGSYLTAFSDSRALSRWAREQMLWAVQRGIITGISGTKGMLLKPKSSLSRAQLAAILMRLLKPYEIQTQELVYGTSGSGDYPLTALRIGSGKNVLVLTYALHGWEDNFNRDGAELLYLADCVKKTLLDNYALLHNHDWTVYLIRCANPDGLYSGGTNNGAGRCTTTRLDENGALLSDGIGIDINRCFPYCYTPLTQARYFNGTAPLQCTEAQALAAFVKSVKGSGYNVCIDTHGWLNQTITSSGMSAIYDAFKSQFPDSVYSPLAGKPGFFSAWAAFCEGFDSCLFELPSDIYSHGDFVRSGYIEQYDKAILRLLIGYYPGVNLPGKLQADCLQPNSMHTEQ